MDDPVPTKWAITFTRNGDSFTEFWEELRIVVEGFRDMDGGYSLVVGSLVPERFCCEDPLEENWSRLSATESAGRSRPYRRYFVLSYGSNITDYPRDPLISAFKMDWGIFGEGNMPQSPTLPGQIADCFEWDYAWVYRDQNER